MAMSRDAYRDQLLALLPPGVAFAREADTNLSALLDAWATELARLEARAEQLRDEADPRTTYEMLTDWERVCGLPSACMAGQPPQTTAERRDAVLGVVGERGGQSVAYFVVLAARLGFVVDIEELRPATTGMSVADPVNGQSWAHAFRVHAPSQTVRSFTAASDVSDPLASWGNAMLECAIREDAPAHAVPLFAYDR